MNKKIFMKKLDFFKQFLGAAFLVCVMVAAATKGASGQSYTTINSGTNVLNTGATYNLPFGFFVNNGTYTDTTTGGAFNVTGGVTFSGSGTTKVYDISFLTSGSNDLTGAAISVYNTATLASGVSLDAGAGNLNLRTDIAPHYNTANLVVNGVLTGSVQGIIAKATVTTGAPGYTSVVSTNISGSVVLYQWESSPDNSSWTPVSGATNPTYTATVTANVYYHVNTSTTNSAFTNTSSSVLLSTGTTPSFDGGSPQSLVVCQNSINNPINSKLTITDLGVALTETYSVTVTPLHGSVTAGTTVTSGTSVAPTGWSYTPTSGYSGTDVFTIQVSNGSNTATTVINVTVNPLPTVAAITGNTTLSTAITTTLADATAGGVWTSAATGTATIGSTTGVVTGVAAGTALISYTVTTSGCSTTVTTNVTVKTPSNALNLDGTNDAVIMPNSATVQINTGTIEAWIKTSGAGSGYRGIVVKQNAYGLFLQNDILVTFDWTTLTAYSTGVNLADGRWHHVAMSFQNGVASGTKIYIDGALSTTFTYFVNNQTAPLVVGQGGAPGPIQNIAGTIDEVRVWNTVLSQSTIQANMNCDLPAQAGLVAYYRFNQGTASGTNTGITGAFDYSGNGNCGTLTSFALTGGSSNYVTGAVGNCSPISDATPGTFSGNVPVCVGSTITLANTNTGGTWTTASGNITINSTSGLVTGVTAGTASVNYTLNCNTSSLIVTINALPVVAAITGNTTLSTAITTTLADATVGGVWTSAATGTATINSTTGVVTGVTAGTALISYTVGTPGCSATATTNVTVKTPTNGLYFNGSNSLVDIGSGILSANHSYTKEAWVYANASSSNNIISASSVPFFLASGTLTVAQGVAINDPTAFPLGQWVHVAATYDAPSSTINLYKNGVLVATTSSAGSYPVEDIMIGAYPPIPSGHNFDGIIDEARIWDIALSQSQIQANMNCDVPQQANLIAYYRFDQGIAGGTNTGLTCAYDYSGNSKSGTLTNFALTGSTSNYVTGAVGSCNTATPIAPGTFSGNTPVCVGSSITLSNANTGGTWSTASSNITLNTASGLVTGVTAGSATVNYTLNCSTSSVTVTVNSLPAAIAGSTVLCTGTSITLTDATSGGTWSTLSSNVTLSGTATTSVTVTGVTAGTANITYTLAAGCYTTTTVTVQPTPVMTVTPTFQQVCNGTGTTAVSFSSSVGGSTYAWNNNNTTIGIGASGTGSPIASFTATNTGTAIASGIFTVTPTAAGCVGAAQTFTISVAPTPIMTVTPTSQQVCNGTGTTAVSFSSSVGSTTYAWNNNNTTIGIGASGTSSPIASFTATNTGTTITSGVFTVTPTASSCVGPVQTFTISVKPTPIMSVTPTAQTVCNNANTTSEIFTSNVAGTTYTWANNNTTIGIGASGSGGSIASFTATNTGSSASAGTFTVTPTAASCVGPVQTFTITVNPTPIMSVTPTAQTVCNGANTSSEIFTSNVAGTTYTWANNNTTIGVGASGSGSSIVSFTATNTGTTQTSGVFTVTPTASSCVGPVQTFTISVNPTPIMSVTPTAQSVCHNQNTSSEVFTSNVAGTTYTWANNNVTIGIGASGSGSTIASFTAAAPTVTNIGVFTVTPTASSCVGPVQTFTITVNPLPIVTFTAQPGANACASTNVTYTTQSGMSSYVWGFPGTAGVDYNIISGGTSVSNTVTLQYFTAGPQTVTVNYTNANGCTAATATSSTPTTIQLAPVITAVSPLVGFPASTIAITGSNFNTTTTNNIVYFGAVKAVVTSSTTTSLNVTVPTGATFQYLSVENNGCGLTGYSGNPFLHNYNNGAFVASTVNLDPNVDFAAGSQPWDIVLGDIDGDGKSDIIVSNDGTNTISVYRNTSTSGSISAGSFAAPVSFITVNLPIGVAVGDIDGDGKLDIAVTTQTSSTVSVFRNTSSPGSVTMAARQDFTTSSITTNVGFADIDKDGKSDMVVCNFSSANVSVFRSTSTSGSISFAARLDFSTGSNPEGLAFGDIDGDGMVDMVVADRGSNTISLYRNTATSGSITAGSFAARVPFATATAPVGLRIVDIDGDGKLDIANSNNASAVLSVFRNTATSGVINSGSLAPRVDFSTGANPFFGNAVGDIDGDGKPDIVGINVLSNSLSVFRNTATSGTINSSSFAQRVDFAANVNPYSVAVGDLDGDGKADVVLTNNASNNISVYRNDPLQPITGPSTVCAGGSTITTITLADATPSGTWTSSNTAIATVGSTTGVVTGISSGVVTITYSGTSGIGNLGNYTVKTITVNPIIVAPTNSSVACVGGLVNFTSGVTATGILTYAWSGPAGYSSALPNPGISSISLAQAGTYTLTVTSSTGCSNFGTTTVTVNPVPTTTPTNNSPVCTGGTVNLFANATAIGTMTLSWVGPTGFSSSIANPTISSVTTANAGVYLITVSTPGSGCIATAVTNVTINPTPSATPTNSSPSCAGGPVTLTANPLAGTGVTGYSWSGPAGFTSTLANPVVSPTVSGTYSLTVSSPGGSGCSPATIYTTIVTVNPVPAAITGNTPVCVGSSFGLANTVTGGRWTSAAPTVASVGSSTGTVTGVSGGMTTITYTLPAGCFVTIPVTINALPSSIGGTLVLCQGGSTTLTNTTSGGVWTSSNTAVVTIGSLSGAVTTGAPGNSTITYTSSTGCTAAAVFTVNASPGAISGNVPVCVLSSTTLSSLPTGGTWVSGNPSMATVGSTTGILTGVAAGNPTITYTLPTGCITTTVATINALPAAITGAGSICVGGSLLLSNTTTGGTWSTLAPGVASVGASSGIVSGVGSGTATIVYTLATGCTATTTVTVNTAAGAITGTAIGCVGFTSTLSSTPTGGTWSSSNTAMATIGSTTGFVNAVAAGNPTITYTLATGCFSTRVLTINPIPSAITGITTMCSASSSTLSSASTGGTWSTSNPLIATVGAVSGIVTGVGVGGVTTINYTLPTGCATSTSVTVNPIPGAFGGTFVGCVGYSTTLTNTATGGTWISSAPTMATITSTGGVVATLAAGNPIMTYTMPGGCFATQTITINPLPAAISGTLSVCSGAITTVYNTTLGGVWSSSAPATAAIGSSTGVITGGTPGTATITYTLPTGCTATAIVTVNAQPSAITGSLAVCVGASGSLASTPTGGTWSSSNPAVGSVSTSGTLTGVSAGSPIITYTLATGCFTTVAATINPNPASIAGTLAVCASGGVTTLTDATTGGIWTSGSTSVATIGSTTGIVTGGVSGTSLITYALPTGCVATAVVTVNALPASITGTLTVCVGSTTNLSDASGTSTWSSSNLGVATIGASTGIVTGVSAGTANITFTMPTGCFTVATVTVNPLPSAITGTTNVCTGATVGLSNATAGGTWTSSNTALATVGSSTGVVSGGTAGTLNIIYTLPTGCLATTAFTVNQTPSVPAGLSTVCVGSSITLTSAPTGGTWTSSNTAQATVVPTTGVVNGLSAGTPTITYTLGTGCFNSLTITVNSLPAAISGPSSVCTGSSVALSSTTMGGTWSSSTAAATVVPTTGVVSGVSSGTTTITYTLPTGCFTTWAMTVNATPTSISGTLSVCTGFSTTLTPTPTGGTWTSSNTAEATIGSSTGVVNGITAGTPIMTYTVASGCFITAVVTVNQTPVATTGSRQVCVGFTTTLNDATTGGTWTSSNVSLATVGSSSGIVNGIAQGTLNIVYTMPTGCNVVTPITVNANPAPLSGPSVVCPGSNITLVSSPTGGNWTSSNISIATVGSTTGIVTGVSAGTVSISYTLGTGCFATAPVTVNPAPNLASFTPPTATSPCVGGSSVVSLTSSTIGAGTFTVTYNLSGANTSTGNTVSVTFSSGSASFTIPSSLLTLTGSENVTITSITNSFGCSTNLTSGNVASFAVNPLPTAFVVSGGGGYCVGGTGVHVLLSGSQVGVNYQLFLGGTPVGGAMAGTSTGLDFGLFTTAGIYTVVATNTTTACVNNMTGSATVTVNPLPTAFLVTGGGSYCAGGTGVPVGLGGSQTGVNYQLFNGTTPIGSPVAGTGSAISFGLQTGGGTYTVVATNATTGCVATMSGSVVVVVNPVPTAFTGAMTICVNGTTTLASTPTGGIWTSSNTSMATVGSSSGFVTGTGPGNPTITYTLSTGCFITGVLTVNPLPAAITGTLNVCVGSTTPLADATTGGLWTSSNPSLATVGSTSAVVSGVGAGVPSITYTLSTGCFVTTPFTVNPTPGAISGFSSVCTGSSITLVNGTTGGTWSSTNTGVATVGSLTGVVSGSTAGTTSIVYTLPAGGCNTSFPVTVNATPAAITGTFTVCAGLTTTLSTTTTGGTWSSSNTSVATVSSTGVVSGLIAGTVTISYTMPSGCFVAASVTVNPTPAAIAGTPAVCVGSTTALTNATPGGVWSSSNSALATVVSTTGVVTGVAVGTPNIIYTLPAGCTAVMTVTVNPNPGSISGPSNVCVFSSVNLSSATPGGTWSSSNPTVASIGFFTGIVTGISAGPVNITYTVSTGCFTTTTITVNPLPLSILGISNVCTGSTVTLTDASAGGVWSSSNSSLATVGSASGVVLGVAVGTPIISYTLPTGCFTTLPVVVNQTPSAITGSSLVCVGAVTTLGNTFGGGTWSSSNSSLASVNSSTGAVTGIAPGNPTITYSLPPGCIATMTVTVMPSPAAITGTAVVCVGASTTLVDVTPGGIWSSANTATATVGSTTGVVVGGTAGLVNISYTLPGGCASIMPVTVNPLPLPITGTLNVCVASSTTLSSASAPGVWTSSNTALATIGSITGTVNGISAGTPTITYTLPTGCFITTPFTVNPLPAAISGSSVVCVNSTITLTNSSAGGSWTVSPITVANIGGSTGTLFGVSAGVATVVYTLPTGCTASKSVTVNPLPFLFSVTGGGAYCAGGSGVRIGLSGSATGVTYQVVFGSTPVGAALAGTGGALDFGLFTLAGTYNVVATIVATGCTVTMTGSATVTGLALPTVYTVSGGGSYCAGGSGLAINLSGSDVGVAYQLFNGTTALGGPVPGTGAAITFGLQTLGGSYTVVATNTSTLCSSSMTGSPSIVINPLPTVFTVIGGGSYCAGGPGVHIGLSNSTVGVNYQLLLGGVTAVGAPIGGTGAAIDFGFITTAGTYTVRATNATTSCTSSMSGSVVVIINSNPVAYAVSGGGTYCAGGSGFVISLSNSDLGVMYQLNMGGSPMGSPVAGTGFGINFGLQTSAGVYTVVATNTSTGCTSNMTGSATIIVNPLPTVFFITGGGSYCAGSAGVTIGLSGSQTGLNYGLFNGTTLTTTVAGTGSVISFGTFTTAGTYTVVAVNATTTCTINMSGSTTITINPAPTSFTVSGGGSYCSGGVGVAVGLVNSQIGINYQLSNGFGLVGSPVAGTGVAISFGLQTVASTYTVIATNPITGCTTTMAGSAVVSISALPTAFNVTGGGTYCTGGSGLAIGLSGSQTGVTYQLFVGTTAVGAPFTGTGSAISFGLQTLPGTYTVVATTISTGCVNNMTGSATINVATLPIVFTVIGGGSYCAGGTGVVVGLSGSQTGVNYQLYRDGISTGSAVPGTGAALTFGLQTTAGTYTVVATSPSTTCTISMSGSAVISINPVPTAYTVTGGGSYCVGGVGVHIGLSSSDAGISYQLKLAGSPVGAPLSGTGSALDFGFITVTGAYTVTATNTTTGCTSNMTGTASVATNPLPTVFTVTGGGSLCAGGAGVNIVLSGSQSGVSYQLMNGTTAVGTPRAGTGVSITFGPITSAGSYTVIATNTSTSCVNNMSGSATITVNPLPTVYAISGGGGYCSGGTGVTIGLVGSQAGVNYQLMTSSGPLGTPVAGTGSAITFGSVTIAGTYFVVATNTSTGCTANMTGTAVVVVNSAPAVIAMSGGGAYCIGGTGVHVGLAGSAVGVNYQLYKGGVPVGLPVPGIGAALDFGLQTAVGTYTAIATNATTGCSSNMSGVATVSTNPLPTAYTVSGGGSYCAGGTGVVVNLSGSQTGVNYQLYNGTTPVGAALSGTGFALSFGLQTAAGTYTVVATNPTTTCTSNMTSSATITINPAPTVYSVTGGGTYCSGGAGLSVGLSGSQTGVTYKLYRTGVLIGSPVAGTGSALSFGTFTTAGTYTVVAVSASSCTSNMTGSAVIVISALPTVYSVGGGGSYCAGGSGVGVTLSGSQSGVSYQLARGTTLVGAPLSGTGLPLSFGLQTIAGVYYVIATNTSTGCTSTMTGSATVTVISAPVAYTVTGGGAYCSGPGYHIGLSGSSTGVTYKLYLGTTVVAGPLSGTGAAIDFGTFTTIGIYTVVATSTSSSCSTGMSGTATITSGSLPTAYTVTGGGSLCTGGTGFAVGLSGSQVGVNYQLYRGTSMVGTAVAGTGSPLNFGIMTTAGGYTVHATNPTTGCLQTMTGSATIIVNPLPTAFAMSGGGGYCSGGTGVAVGLAGSSSGVSYKLYRGTTLVSTVGGTGAAISFGLQTTAGTYSVVAVNTASGCTNNMTTSVTVTVNTTPTISGSIYTVAPGSSITLTGSPSGGTWVSGTTSVATVGSTGSVTGVALGTSNIVYTMPTGCLATRMVSVTPTGHKNNPGTSAGIASSDNGSIFVSPNPNKGTFVIKGNLSVTDDVDVTFEITNMLGQVVYNNKVVAQKGELNEVIQLGNIANGMYLLNMHANADRKVFHIIVEQQDFSCNIYKTAPDSEGRFFVARLLYLNKKYLNKNKLLIKM